jgi:hypothetical protein
MEYFRTRSELYKAELIKSLEAQIWALVLEPTGKVGHEYRRLGIARVSEVLVEGWETQVITIV